VVYTAIFDNYDPPPAVAAPDPSLSYILFTDTQRQTPYPWQVRVLPAIFADPQRDARRVKLLPHLFVPEYDVSVWIDANCTLLDLTAAAIHGFLGEADIALAPHEAHRCIYEEADAVLALNYDSPIRVERHMAAYRAAGFPERFGLHATMFLIRRHNAPACRRFDLAWWEQVHRYSKRDQLSFDFVRWQLRPRVATLPLRYTENPIFRWGMGHGSARRTASEHDGVGVRHDGASFPFLVAPYDPSYDVWPADFLFHLRKLNEIVASSGEPLEGNLFYFDGLNPDVCAPPDPRRGERRETFLRALAGRRRCLEIGFNAGHSALLALTHGMAEVCSLDIAIHRYTRPAAEYLGEAFPGRFSFVAMDSRLLVDRAGALAVDTCDMVHIDGSHDAVVFANDVAAVLGHCRVATLVLIDDAYVADIARITGQLVTEGFLEPCEDLRTAESAAYVLTRAAPGEGVLALAARLAAVEATPDRAQAQHA
jgi:Protein of unknown function (DUF616)